MSKVELLIVGVGGFGTNYFDEVVRKPDGNIVIKGIVDPMAEASRVYGALKESGIPVFDTLGEFYSGNRADMAAISTPIHLHYRHALECVKNGSYVLLEKPVCSSSIEAKKLLEAEKEYDRFIAIGYQLNYSNDVLMLKRDILDGKFGKPLRFSTLTANPRGTKYYKRNNWAGKFRTDTGDIVFDSPVHNANAHYLHLMLFLLGDEYDSACTPISIEAEAYRANKNIENLDTAAIKCSTDTAEVFFYTSHAVPELIDLVCRFEFEKGTIYSGGEYGKGFTAVFRNGETINYSNNNQNEGMKKLWTCAESVVNGTRPPCTVKTALPQLLVVEALQEIYGNGCSIGEEYLVYRETDNQRFCYVNGMDRVLSECFTQNALPKQIGAPWAKEAQKAVIKP